MTEVDFFAGFDPVCLVPRAVKQAGLTQRFAVIQHTYRADCPDMYFDQALWRRLVEFAEQLGPEVRVVPAEGQPEMTVEAFIDTWQGVPDVERDPPAFVLVREGPTLRLLMATEYWARVGGPPRYHDSFTYSLFSNADLGGRVREFLAGAPGAGDWKMAVA